MIQPDPRRYAPASERNRQPILEVLARILPKQGRVLEIASGSGEHAVWFAKHLRSLSWQPSDPNADCRASIAAHAADSGCVNIASPLELDVTQPHWPVSGIDAMVCINMIHIAPWSASEGLMTGAGRLLAAGGLLYLYGPFRREGRHTAPSNARFDETLRAQDPRWGVRDLDAVSALAEEQGLAFREAIEMPANNLSAWFEKS